MQSIVAFEHSLQLNPVFRSAYIYLGRVSLDQGDYTQALAQYERARQLRETPRLLLRIAAAYTGLGLGEDGELGQPVLNGLGTAEVNHLRNRFYVLYGDQYVRWLDIPMDDRLRVRLMRA